MSKQGPISDFMNSSNSKHPQRKKSASGTKSDFLFNLMGEGSQENQSYAPTSLMSAVKKVDLSINKFK